MWDLSWNPNNNIGRQDFHFHCSICNYDLHLHCALLDCYLMLRNAIASISIKNFPEYGKGARKSRTWARAYNGFILLPRILRQRQWCTTSERVLLLQETRYEWHFHQVFNLVYEIKGEVCESDEYYCHVCEKRLYEKCAHCEYTAHLACVVPSTWLYRIQIYIKT